MKLSPVQRAEKKATKILKRSSEAAELVSAISRYTGRNFKDHVEQQMSFYVRPSTKAKRFLEDLTFGLYKSPQTKLFSALMKLEPPELMEKQVKQP